VRSEEAPERVSCAYPPYRYPYRYSGCPTSCCHRQRSACCPPHCRYQCPSSHPHYQTGPVPGPITIFQVISQPSSVLMIRILKKNTHTQKNRPMHSQTVMLDTQIYNETCLFQMEDLFKARPDIRLHFLSFKNTTGTVYPASQFGTVPVLITGIRSKNGNKKMNFPNDNR
jgi:hypothetical protein